MKQLYQYETRLLVVFLSLYEELNVSRAAKRLGLSQPAVSHALARLRNDFNDDLFLRAGKGITPSPKAQQLKPLIEQIVTAVSELYVEQIPFHPKVFHGLAKIVTSDFFELLLLPKLLPRLAKEAPHLQIVTRPSDGNLPKYELESGTVSLAIAGFFGELPEGFFRQKVMTEKYVCIAGKQNRKVGTKLSLSEFCDSDHILVSPHGDLKGIVDEVLLKQKKQRKVRVGVGHFQVTASIVIASDCIATVPLRLAKHLQDYYPIKLFEPPIEIPSFSIYQIWHGRTHRDPMQQWLRTQIADAVRDDG